MKNIYTLLFFILLIISDVCSAQKKESKFKHSVGLSFTFESNEGTVGPSFRYSSDYSFNKTFGLTGSFTFYQNLDIIEKGPYISGATPERGPSSYQYYTSAFLDFGLFANLLHFKNRAALQFNGGYTYQHGFSQFPFMLSYNNQLGGWGEWQYEREKLSFSGFHAKLKYVPAMKRTLNPGFEIATHTMTTAGWYFPEILSLGVNLYIGKSGK